MTLDEYLDYTVFCDERAFCAGRFQGLHEGLSQPFPQTIEVARDLARAPDAPPDDPEQRVGGAERPSPEHVRPPAALHRLLQLLLGGRVKPARRIYEVALAISQAEPDGVRVHRRPAAEPRARGGLGMKTILFKDAAPAAPATWRRWAWAPEDGDGRCSSP